MDNCRAIPGPSCLAAGVALEFFPRAKLLGSRRAVLFAAVAEEGLLWGGCRTADRLLVNRRAWMPMRLLIYRGGFREEREGPILGGRAVIVIGQRFDVISSCRWRSW